jgi:hypothetical protein
MKLQFNVDDKVFEEYVTRWGIPGCYTTMRKAVETFKDFEKSDRYVVLYGKPRQEIEAVFQTTIDDGAKLAKLVKNMSKFSIGGVEINFTADELARIDMQATFHGRTRDQYIKETCAEIKDRFLENV